AYARRLPDEKAGFHAQNVDGFLPLGGSPCRAITNVQRNQMFFSGVAKAGAGRPLPVDKLSAALWFANVGVCQQGCQPVVKGIVVFNTLGCWRVEKCLEIVK